MPLKARKGITITNALQKTVDESNWKPNKIWVDKGSEFYNRSMKSVVQNNDMEIYSPHNEWKSVIAERLIGAFSKIYKYVTSISKNVYTDKLEMLRMILREKKLLEYFTKNNCKKKKKKIKKSLELKK